MSDTTNKLSLPGVPLEYIQHALQVSHYELLFTLIYLANDICMLEAVCVVHSTKFSAKTFCGYNSIISISIKRGSKKRFSTLHELATLLCIA